MDDKEIKLRCLEIASKLPGVGTPMPEETTKRVLDAAAALHSFVTGPAAKQSTLRIPKT